MTDSAPVQSRVENVLDRATPFVEFVIGQLPDDRQGIHVVYLHADTALRVERTYGTLDDRHDYVGIAGSKAELTCEHERPTDEIPLLDRSEGDTIFWGSIWDPHYRHSFAGSALPPWFDKLISQGANSHFYNAAGNPVNLGQPSSRWKIEGDFLIPAHA